jgi:hypothetical protein
MNIRPRTHKLELILKKHQLLALDEIQPKMAIECKEGVIWVTRTGEQQDYVLRAGRHYVPKGQGMLVIEAIADSCVDIVEP